VYVTLTARRGDHPVRKEAAASLFLFLTGAGQPDEADVDDATEANLRGISR